MKGGIWDWRDSGLKGYREEGIKERRETGKEDKDRRYDVSIETKSCCITFGVVVVETLTSDHKVPGFNS